MSAKTVRKMRQRIADSARILVKELERWERKCPGECIPKDKLVEMAEAGADIYFKDMETMYHITEAVPPPEAKFMLSKWSIITKYAARNLKKYIVFNDPSPGVRLGTFAEYCQQQNDLLKIIRGSADNIEDRTKIIVEQGGKSYVVTLNVKQLTSGELHLTVDDTEEEADKPE